MRGALFRSPRGLSPAVLLVLTSSALAPGCAERADIVMARIHAERGQLREAYRDYHHAYLESDDPRDREVRDRLGTEISADIARKALEKERAGDLRAALVGYQNALEYDPGCGDLIARFLVVEERLLRIGAVAAEAASRKGTWEAYRLWRELSDVEPLPEVLRAMGEAAATASDVESARLVSEGSDAFIDARGSAEGSDLGLRLPRDAAGLTRRLAAARELDARLEEVVVEGGSACAPWLDDLLAPHRSLLAGLERAVGFALRAEECRAEAAARAEAGDFHGAIRGYLRALLLWPDQPRIRDGLDRALEAMVLRTRARARSAMAAGRWDEGLYALKTLTAIDPSDRRVSDVAARCESEIRAGLLTEGARLRERGLPGNALVLFLKARCLSPWAELERGIAGLEDEIAADHAVEFAVDPSPLAEEDEILSAIFWGEGVARALVEEIRRTFPPQFSSSDSAAEPLDGARSEPGLISATVEDLEFRYRREESPGGLGESLFVTDFVEGENPDRVRADQALNEARAALERAKAALACAGPGEREGAAANLTIAEGRERQAAATRERILATVPVPVWKKESYPVVKVRVESSLAILVSIESGSRWLEARLAAEGREVEGNASRGIAPQSADVPSREEALRELSATLCQKVALCLREKRDARLRRLVEAAVAKMRAKASEEAVEDLVGFLYSRRGEREPPGFQRAVEALRSASGLDLMAAWAAQPAPGR